MVLLGREHERVRGLLDALAATPGVRDGAAASELSRRRAVVGDIVRRLSAHEVAEEELFWPAVADAVDGGPSIVEVARRQEKHAKRALHQLHRSGAGGDRFEHLVGTLTELLRAHMAFEDSVFAKVVEQVAEESRRSLGARVARAVERGPTRPHPHAPSGAGLLHVVGPLSAAFDRRRRR